MFLGPPHNPEWFVEGELQTEPLKEQHRLQAFASQDKRPYEVQYRDFFYRDSET